MKVGEQPTPTEHPGIEDADLQFAAFAMCRSYRRLAGVREEALAALKELKHRWRPVTSHLRKLQPPTVRRVTAERDIGLLGILIVLPHWPDVAYALDLIQGFPTVGYAPWCRIYSEKEAEHISLE